MLRLLLPSITFCTLGLALAVSGVRAQTDLDAGKSGPQLFAQDCVACHRSPHALLKNISSFGLVGFLRQHYTSSSASANTLATYIMSVGRAPDPKKGKGAESQQQHAKQAPPAREPRGGAAQPAETEQAHARQGEPAHEPAERAGRRPRRPAPAETGATPPAPETAPTAESAAPPAAQQTAAAPQAAPPPPPVPAEPGFTEPLP